MSAFEHFKIASCLVQIASLTSAVFVGPLCCSDDFVML